MKRFDEYKEIESRQTGVVTRNLSIGEFKTVDQTYYMVRVQCRKCGNIHDINTNCQTCDIETKIRQ